MRWLLFALALLAAPVALADDPFQKMATPQRPPPIDPESARAAQELQQRTDAAARDAERRAKEEELLRHGTAADVERYRIETQRQDAAQEQLEKLDRRALERVTEPTPPAEDAARERERTAEQEAQEKRTGVVEQKVRVRERRERETPIEPR